MASQRVLLAIVPCLFLYSEKAGPLKALVGVAFALWEGNNLFPAVVSGILPSSLLDILRVESSLPGRMGQNNHW